MAGTTDSPAGCLNRLNLGFRVVRGSTQGVVNLLKKTYSWLVSALKSFLIICLLISGWPFLNAFLLNMFPKLAKVRGFKRWNNWEPLSFDSDGEMKVKAKVWVASNFILWSFLIFWYFLGQYIE